MTASLPTDVPSYTPKVAGVDVIRAAHVNNLQDEIEEAGKIIVGPTRHNLLGLGVRQDGSQDNLAAFNSAFSTYGVGEYIMPPSTQPALVSDTLVVPDKTVINGAGRSASEIKAGPTFPIDTPVVRLGSGAGMVFGCRLENLTVHCNTIAGSIGVWSTEANELSAVRNCLIRSFLDKGIFYDTSSLQNCELEHLEIMASISATASTVGILVNGYLRSARDITLNAESTGTMGTAIKVNAPGCTYQDIHIEKCTTGILVGKDAIVSAIKISNIIGHSTVTDLVRISDDPGQSHNYVVECLSKMSGTNILVDEQMGLTATDASVGLWAVGSGTVKPVLSTIPSFESRLAQGVRIGAGSASHDSKTSRRRMGSATWDPGSVADGAMTSTTLTVTDAVVGDMVKVGFSNAVPAGAILTGNVTAAGTVTVTLFNKTGGALDLASGTLKASIERWV